MARVGTAALKAMNGSTFIPLLHSMGAPLAAAQKDVPWPCNPDNVIVAHFVGVPTSKALEEDFSCWAFGSNFGFNAILSKHGMGTRLGSVLARREGKQRRSDFRANF
jgi:phosphoenolpyruvate carboxykinase (GTP)